MASQPSPIQRRARAQLSCTLCRTGKLKCDRGHPCDQCVKRSKDTQCHYQPAPKKKPRKPASTKDRIAQLEDLVVKLMKQDGAASRAAMAAATGGGAPIGFASSSNGRAKDEPVQELTPESRGTLSSPEAQLEGSEEETDDEGSDVGQISMSNSGGTNYVGGAHWESILSRIEQLKTSVGNDAEEISKPNEQTASSRAQNRLILMGSATVSKEYLIKMCPTRQVAERLLYAWFNSQNPLSPLIHRPTFLKEYEMFVQNPAGTPVAWIGMYFGMLSLGCQVSLFQREVQDSLNDGKQDSEHYQMLCSEALVLADITRPQKYSIEALMTSAACEHLRGDNGNSTRLWLILSTVLRLCMRMGYHRDPSLLKSLSPFECEMRRRVWYTVYIFDVLVSFSLGLPDMIRQIQSDTRPPRNLGDTDIEPAMTELPASRPFVEMTPVAYCIVKARIVKLFARAADISHSLSHPDAAEVAAIDEDLEQAYGGIPEALKFVSMSQCMFDPPPVVFNRFKLQLMYQKTKCTLYRRYLGGKNLTPEEEPFRDKCSEAAVNLLKHWEVLHDASQQGGQLATMPFFLDSLSVSDFLLAVMIACLELDRLRQSPATLDSASQEKMASIKAVLESTYRVYTKSINHQERARMPEKALKALALILNKAKIMRKSPFTYLSTPELPTKTSPSITEPFKFSPSQRTTVSPDSAFGTQSFPTPPESYTSNSMAWQEPLNNNFSSTDAINWQIWDASLRNSMTVDLPTAPCPYGGLDMNLDMIGGIGGFNNYDGSMSTDFTTTAPWFQ